MSGQEGRGRTRRRESGGQEEGNDKISLVSFLEVRDTPNIYFVLLLLYGGLKGILSMPHRLTYHDDSSRLLCCAHTHDGCHTDGGALEIDPTKGGQNRGQHIINTSTVTLKVRRRVFDH